jgi:hypothetical protein
MKMIAAAAVAVLLVAAPGAQARDASSICKGTLMPPPALRRRAAGADACLRRCCVRVARCTGCAAAPRADAGAPRRSGEQLACA